MSFNASFAVSQGTDPTSFTLTDNSSGSDGGLTDRRISLFLSDGTTLVPPGSSTSYIDWPIAQNSITLTGILQRDYSINISVTWISSSPLAPPSTYIYASLNTFVNNLRVFLLGLTQMQAGNPLLINDNGYFPNKSKMRVLIEDALDCNTYGDQFTAQQSLNEAYKMQQNVKSYF